MNDIINLEFTDYAILALLLGVLYLITAIEFHLSKASKPLGESKERSLKKSGVIAFIGIIVTLICGVAMELGLSWFIEGGLLLLPLAFILLWAGFHRKATDIIDLKEFDIHIEDYHKRRIKKCLEDSQLIGLSFDEIRSTIAILDNDFLSTIYDRTFKRNSNLSFLITKENMNELLSPIVLTNDKIFRFLDELMMEGQVARNPEGRYLFVSNNRS